MAAAQADAVEQARTAAADLGLPLTDRLQEDGAAHAGTRFVSLVPGSFKADGTVVLALLQGQLLVAANWLQAWRARSM